jgi:hypothetical protein
LGVCVYLLFFARCSSKVVGDVSMIHQNDHQEGCSKKGVREWRCPKGKIKWSCRKVVTIKWKAVCCRALQKEVDLQRQMLKEVTTSIKQIMDEHNQKRLANVIINFISKSLVTCLGPQSRKLVLGCVLSHSKFCMIYLIMFSLLNLLFPNKKSLLGSTKH